MGKPQSTDEFILNIFKRIDQAQTGQIKPLRKIAIFATPRSGSSFFL